MIDKLITYDLEPQQAVIHVSQHESEHPKGFALRFQDPSDFTIESNKPHDPVTLEFFVDNLDMVYENLLKKGIKSIEGPIVTPWGLRSIWFSNNTGYRVQFSQSIA